MAVVIDGNNTPTAGGVGYGDGTELAFTSAGSSGQALLSAGAGVPTWGTPTASTATTATNLAGGFAGNVPYQSAPGATGMVAAGSSGQALLSNGASAPTWGTPATATTATNLAGGSNGTIPYQSAAGTTQMLAVGSSGQLLRSNGASAPSWTAAPASGLTFLSTVTASSSATVDIETTFNSTYRAYLIIGTGVFCESNSIFNCRLKIGGSYISTNNYGYHRHNLTAGTSAYEAVASDGANTLPISAAMSTARSADFVMTVYFPSDTTSEKKVDWRFAPGRLANNFSTGAVGYGSNSNTAALTGVRFYFETGNVASGEFRLYGIANS